MNFSPTLTRAAGATLVVAACWLATGCQSTPTPEVAAANANALDASAQATIARFRAADPSIESFFQSSYAYAVFPRIGQGGFIVGGGGGDGVVFRNGAVIGSTRVAFGTVGAQIGGQTLSQIIFFQDEAVFERFRSNNLEFAANASAVAVRAGGAASAGYANGVATFAMSDGGLMANASIGGQKFTYTPR